MIVSELMLLSIDTFFFPIDLLAKRVRRSINEFLVNGDNDHHDP